MIVTVERVNTLNLRNLLGHDAPQSIIDDHLRCITDSVAIWLGRADGVEACAAGVIPYGSLFGQKAYIWLIHTRICEQHPLRFMRWSRKVMDDIRQHYPTIIGLCRCDSPGSQAWLKWLGASFDRGSIHNGCYRFRIG